MRSYTYREILDGLAEIEATIRRVDPWECLLPSGLVTHFDFEDVDGETIVIDSADEDFPDDEVFECEDDSLPWHVADDGASLDLRTLEEALAYVEGWFDDYDLEGGALAEELVVRAYQPGSGNDSEEFTLDVGDRVRKIVNLGDVFDLQVLRADGSAWDFVRSESRPVLAPPSVDAVN